MSLVADTLVPFQPRESNMSFSFGLLLYAILGLASTGLRMGQGAVAEDALFCGLFWPMDVTRRWIELVMRALLRAGWEEGRAAGRAAGRA